MPGVDFITLYVKSQSIQRYPERKREKETLNLKPTIVQTGSCSSFALKNNSYIDICGALNP